MAGFKPELSVWSAYYIDLSPEDAVLELKKNGIYATELSDEHGYMLLQRGDAAEVGRAFREFLEKENFTVTQGHLFLKVKLVSDETAVDELEKWLRLYDAIGIKNAVLHADRIMDEPELPMEERILRNREKLIRLYERTKELKIRIAMENVSAMTDIDSILTLIEPLDEARFGVCLDTGHLNFSDSPDQTAFIRKAGKRLIALHIADNEGKTDQHMMPFGKGNVDFEAVVRALREVGYSGLFNLEIPGERHAPMPVLGAKLRYIREVYEYLMNVE